MVRFRFIECYIKHGRQLEFGDVFPKGLVQWHELTNLSQTSKSAL